jgi:heme-degrading monooxygenase HmoA
MYIIIWAYQVKPDQVVRFEEAYSSNGAWVKLFQRSQGFLETELLRDHEDPYRYITIDRWNSAQEYKSFLSQSKTEYAAMDARCEGLTEHETLLGNWDITAPWTG